MSNVIPFRRPRRGGGHANAREATEPALADHAVQFYERSSALVESVGRFVRGGLAGGDQILLLVSAENREALLAQLEAGDLDDLVAARRLTVFDVEDVLAELMVGDRPDAKLFAELLQRITATIREQHPGARIRAFGELASVLWRGGNRAAALGIEELWDVTVKELSLSLLCGYALDQFRRPSDSGSFVDICENHSLVLPTERVAEDADLRTHLREIARLQQRTHALESELKILRRGPRRRSHEDGLD